MKFEFIDLFAGLGGFHKALQELGGKCVFAAEKNPHLNMLYTKNYPEVSKDMVAFDITTVDYSTIPRHDILCAGFPCQPYSKAGKRKGMKDPINGFLYNAIIDIIDSQKIPPKYILLENVPNILTLDNGRYWRKIETTLKERNYQIDWKVLSPDNYGIPQVRKRVFLVASKSGLEHFDWPKELKKEYTIDDFIEENPDSIRHLADNKEEVLELWSYFIKKVTKGRSLGFPIWAAEFGATYPHENLHPLKYSFEELVKFKGSFGKQLQGNNGIIDRNLLPTYVRDARRPVKSWKSNYINKNRQLYLENKNWIDGWKNDLIKFPHSLQKFEWNCQDEERTLNDKIIQFRPSGVRVKSRTSIPALVAMNLTQVPYFPWLKRYMTIREGLALQGLEELKYVNESESENYRALGNAVNAKVVHKIAKNLIVN
jgi:DNA (cytosine-5)-methyltransferase 1